MLRSCIKWKHSFQWQRHFSSGANLAATKYRPRRAIMYVPGMDQRKMDKVPSLGADTIVFDIEDGVAADQKETARHMIPRALAQLSIPMTTEVVVRVNGLASGLMREDLRVILRDSPSNLPEALMIPKVQSAQDLTKVDTMVKELCPPAKQQPLPLFLLIEDPMGLLNLRDICHHGVHNCSSVTAQVIVFGSDDYLASIGGVRTEDATELLYARQSIVTHAKAYQLQAIDLVHIDFKNLSSLQRQSQEGANMGFTGKQVIHPSQVDVVQKAFMPSQDQITWATGLIEAFHEHQQLGKGAFTYQGRMIDKPLLLQAENIVNLHKTISAATATTTT